MQQNDQFEEDENYLFHLLKYDEKVQQYLLKYNPRGNDQFLKAYTGLKIKFMAKGDAAAEKAQDRDEQILKLAQKCLLEIQLKKLFDKMLQWNANLFKHESIGITRDFEKWEYDLVNCPFLTPISEDEFELYLQYAKGPAFDFEANTLLTFLERHLDQERAKQTEEDAAEMDKELLEEMEIKDLKKDCEEWDKDIEWDENAEVDEEVKWPHFINQPDFPAWFAYNNEHTSNGDYLKLPQIRAVKEHFYLQLEEEEECLEEFDDDEYDEGGEGDEGEENEHAKPWAMAFDYLTVKKFILACEDRQVLDKFSKYYDANPHEMWQYTKERERHAWLEANAREAFDKLIGMKKLVPSLANKDWRKALIDAYKEFKKKEIIKALPYVYSDYCMRLSMGVGIDWQHEQREAARFSADFIGSRILRGRLINGEPEDFNF